MEDRNVMWILHTVSRGSSVLGLLNAGYTYSQIALFIAEITALGYLSQNEGDLKLTQRGRKELERLLDKQNLHGNHQWILPQTIYKTKPIRKYDIILPDKIL